jgi:hypothetical protein
LTGGGDLLISLLAFRRSKWTTLIDLVEKKPVRFGVFRPLKEATVK